MVLLLKTELFNIGKKSSSEDLVFFHFCLFSYTHIHPYTSTYMKSVIEALPSCNLQFSLKM